MAKADHLLFRTAGSLGHPVLDRTLIPLSRVADRSLLWLGIAAALAAAGGRFGRRAALRGVLSLVVTSALVNGPLKLLAARRRPPNPTPRSRALPRTHSSSSFPSGHSASASSRARSGCRAGPAAELTTKVMPLPSGKESVPTRTSSGTVWAGSCGATGQSRVDPRATAAPTAAPAMTSVG